MTAKAAGVPRILPFPEWWKRLWPRQSRTYSLTLEGWLVIVLMGVVGIAAWNSGTNLLYLLLASMIGLFLTHGLFALHFMNRLEMQRLLPAEGTARQPVSVAVTIQNKKRFLPAFGIQVQSYTQEGKLAGEGFCAQVRAGTTAEVLCPVVFPWRGIYCFENLLISSGFPFGFARRGYLLRERQTILILPEISPIAELSLGMGLNQGDEAGQEKGVGIEPYALREYGQGDPVRNIHWKTTARTGRPMVMEFVAEEARRVYVALELLCDELPEEDVRFETAVELAASLVSHLIQRGYEVGLICGARVVPPGRQDSTILESLRVLARVELIPEDVQSSTTPKLELLAERALCFRILHGPDPTNGSTSSSQDLVVTLDSRHWKLHRGQWTRLGGASGFSHLDPRKSAFTNASSTGSV